VSPEEGKALQKTSPELVVVPHQVIGQGFIYMRTDQPPFNDIRVRRAQLKKDLKTGSVHIDQILGNPPEYVSTATVFAILMAVPKFGRVKAARFLAPVGKTPVLRAELPSNNAIDDAVFTKLALLRIHPSPPCTDGEFLRRVTL